MSNFNINKFETKFAMLDTGSIANHIYETGKNDTAFDSEMNADLVLAAQTFVSDIEEDKKDAYQFFGLWKEGYLSQIEHLNDEIEKMPPINAKDFKSHDDFVKSFDERDNIINQMYTEAAKDFKWPEVINHIYEALNKMESTSDPRSAMFMNAVIEGLERINDDEYVEQEIVRVEKRLEELKAGQR